MRRRTRQDEGKRHVSGFAALDGPELVYEQIIASLTSGVLAVDQNGVIITANAAAAAHLNLPPDRLAPGMAFEGAAELEGFAGILQELAETRTPITRRELTIEEADGERVIGMTASPLSGAEDFGGAIFLFTDLTEVRALQRAAELNRQLAQIGELTAGVVHELRNPLSVISGMAELVLRKLDGDDNLRKKLSTIHEESLNLEKVITQFLNFARPFDLQKGRCASDEILERTEQLCQRAALENGATIETHAPETPLVLEADLTKLSQALANIVRNGVEAVGSGGRVDVYGVQDGDFAVFRVEDDGPGINMKPGEDPFCAFVTKKAGGTGLGLSIVHRIVTAHGGTVCCGNRAEKGAWFEVRIPLPAG